MRVWWNGEVGLFGTELSSDSARWTRVLGVRVVPAVRLFQCPMSDHWFGTLKKTYRCDANVRA